MGINAVIINKTKRLYMSFGIRKHSFNFGPHASFYLWLKGEVWTDRIERSPWAGDDVAVIGDIDLQDYQYHGYEDLNWKCDHSPEAIWKDYWLEDHYIDDKKKVICEWMANLY